MAEYSGEGGYDETGYIEEEYGDEYYVDQGQGGYDESGYTDAYAETAQEDESYTETVHDGYSDAGSFAESHNGQGYGGGYQQIEAVDKLAVGYEDVLGVSAEETSNEQELEAGWEAMYDESMGAHYWLNETTGEATWVKPVAETPYEEDQEEEGGGYNDDTGQEKGNAEEASGWADGSGADGGAGTLRAKREQGFTSSAKGPLMSQTNAFTYDAASRTWNPHDSNGNVMATRGSLFASLRPRVTPVVVKTLSTLAHHSTGSGGGHGGEESGGAGLALMDKGALALEHTLSTAEQEVKRLRIFRQHLKNHGKSSKPSGSIPTTSGGGGGVRLPSVVETTGPPPPSGPPPGSSAAEKNHHHQQNQQKQQQQQRRLRQLQQSKTQGGRGGGGAMVGRLNTPQKLAAVQERVEGELSKAQEELERAKAFHAMRAKLKPSPNSVAKTKKEKKAHSTGQNSNDDGAQWSSVHWSVGPKGFVHPPACTSTGDFDAYGEKALEAAWSKRHRPLSLASATELNRFALGVPEPPPKRGPPPHLSPQKQRFGDEMDHYALLCLHYHTAGQGWGRRNGWNDALHAKRPPGSHFAWFGVHTLSTQDHRVSNIVLPKNNLQGPLVDEIRWLDKLKALSLPNNQITGPLPPAWSTLTSLATLDLNNNQITGPLPARFFEGMKRNRSNASNGTAAGLRSLNLSGNKLWGEIPYTVSTLEALTSLNLSSNTMSQALPEGLLSCSSLKTLRLSFNKFTGPLPADLSKLTLLSIFEAAGNEFEGDLPALPPRLSKLHLQSNRFSHDLPPSFFQLTNLADVNLSNNNLSGAVSDDVANLKALRVFTLTGNRYSAADKAVITDSLNIYLPVLVRQQGFRI